MSEPIPESIPTSTGHRPSKRRALTPRSAQANHISSLFASPSLANLPTNSKPSSSSSAPPEIVANVQGSSAGAGSGEFHVYKASRRREYERLRAMDEEVQREGEEKDFLEKKEEMERRDREKTERNRAKRAKALARKMGKGKATGTSEDGGKGVKRKLVPSSGAGKGKVEGEGEGEGEGEKRDGEEEAGLVTIEEKGLVIEDDE